MGNLGSLRDAVPVEVRPQLIAFREMVRKRHPEDFFHALGTGWGGDFIVRTELTVGWKGLDEAIVVEVSIVEKKKLELAAEVRGLNSRIVHVRILPLPFDPGFGVGNMAIAAGVVARSICVMAEYVPIFGLHDEDRNAARMTVDSPEFEEWNAAFMANPIGDDIDAAIRIMQADGMETPSLQMADNLKRALALLADRRFKVELQRRASLAAKRLTNPPERIAAVDLLGWTGHGKP